MHSHSVNALTSFLFSMRRATHLGIQFPTMPALTISGSAAERGALRSLIHTIYGVDFSGAKLAGENIWIAMAGVADAGVSLGNAKLRLLTLDRLADLASTAERGTSLGYLVQMILTSKQALWGIDFPFALPIEIVDSGWGLKEQIEWVRSHGGDAYSFGRECVELAIKIGDKMHIRRETDRQTKTPFDCYHYRIICQTFHGMRDVLGKIHGTKGTIIPPFDRMRKFDRAVVEACPGSTLKRWGVPHNNYKQPAGGALEPKRIKNRKIILTRLREVIEISPAHLRAIQRNPGGDALDAVLAAVGVWETWTRSDWKAIAKHPRYSREGMVFA